MLSLANYLAGYPAALMEQALFLGGVFTASLIGLTLAYSALELEESAAQDATARLKLSARMFFVSMLGLGIGLMTLPLYD